MPAPALKSLAAKSDKSLNDAEKYWKEAKREHVKKTGRSEDEFTDDDWRYVMGIVKKRLGLSKAEELIDLLLQSKDEVVGPIRPRRKSLAQKQGARKGGRTRMRRTSMEGFGGLYHEYFHRYKESLAGEVEDNG